MPQQFAFVDCQKDRQFCILPANATQDPDIVIGGLLCEQRQFPIIHCDHYDAGLVSTLEEK